MDSFVAVCIRIRVVVVVVVVVVVARIVVRIVAVLLVECNNVNAFAARTLGGLDSNGANG